ncbi:LacI family transcriptional regulator [Nakamurella antarctica]|uniref:LacI family transcriptional regulator n=1 Tax=Nakamurella antarctica TaxID=1902245 RepID=A0A3G8ZN22_9ACTN|nr:LacI family DNA-binding transcriptional regulator [Nakamurella antarctica]AZI58653.1 LacI family transcriptional regulator [Nakamurella antarctica]
MAQHATLADVALLAGVSLATASRALAEGHGRTVGVDLRARVHAAALELNYSPNANAQAMRGRRFTIGMVVHDIADPVAATIASGVLAAAREKGIPVSIATTGTDADAEVRHVEMLRQLRVSAIILAGSRFVESSAQRWLEEEVAAMRGGGGSVVVIGQPQLHTDTIAVDNFGGAAHLARVLWSQGYRRFAVLAGPEELLTSQDRLAGFRQGLADNGRALPEENVLSSEMTRKGGYTAMTELLERDIDVDCVFAVTDMMAVGAMAALRDQRLSVPTDMAIAGFGDIPVLRDIQPSLTTVRLPLEQMGRRALALAISTSGSVDVTEPVVESVEGEVVVRASTPGLAG